MQVASGWLSCAKAPSVSVRLRSGQHAVLSRAAAHPSLSPQATTILPLNVHPSATVGTGCHMSACENACISRGRDWLQGIWRQLCRDALRGHAPGVQARGQPAAACAGAQDASFCWQKGLSCADMPCTVHLQAQLCRHAMHRWQNLKACHAFLCMCAASHLQLHGGAGH